jgi:pentatricopeptide repeat protein
MERDGVERDVILYNSALQGYGRAGKLDKMEQLFQSLQSKLRHPSLHTHTHSCSLLTL